MKTVKLRYLKNICMMFLKFYITFYLHLRNVIEKCFRYNIKCYKNVMCFLYNIKCYKNVFAGRSHNLTGSRIRSTAVMSRLLSAGR